MPIEDLWPLFALRIVTPRLLLRYPTDVDLAAAADAAAAGIHDPATMPFDIPWTDAPPELLRRNALQYWWGLRASWKATDWALPMAVVESDRVVGIQEMRGKDFIVTRAVNTGSWLTRAAQGKGIGTEMRAAIIHLAFEGLGAQRALSGAFDDNPASLAVSRSLGYVVNGDSLDARRGQPARHINLLLERSTWELRRRHDIGIEGLDACLPLFGL